MESNKHQIVRFSYGDNQAICSDDIFTIICFVGTFLSYRPQFAIPRTLITESKITTSHQPEQLDGYSLFLADNLGIILIMKNLPLNRNENKILVDENMNKFLIYSRIKILFSFLLMFGYYESTVLISMSSLFTSNLICLSYFAKLKTDPTNLF